MTRSGGNRNRGIESNWMELSTLAALFASLMAVWVNGCESDERNHAHDHMHQESARQEDLASRPYIAISLAEFELHPVGGIRFGLPLNMPNLGQLPADTHIKCMVKYSAAQLATAPGIENVAEQHRVIPPGAGEPITAYSQEPISAGQADDIQHGRGWIYLVAEVSYNGHATRVCQEFPIIAAKPNGASNKPTPAQLARYALCGESQSNHFD